MEREKSCEHTTNRAKLHELLHERREARKRGDSVTEVSKKIQHEMRALARMRRRSQIDQILSEFKGIKAIIHAGKVKSKEKISSMKNDAGTVQTDKYEIVEVFASFYE